MRSLPEGTRIRHVRLGFGWVLESDNERTLIDFEIYGFMRFNTRFVEVQVIQAAPALGRSLAR